MEFYRRYYFSIKFFNIMYLFIKITNIKFEVNRNDLFLSSEKAIFRCFNFLERIDRNLFAMFPSILYFFIT